MLIETSATKATKATKAIKAIKAIKAAMADFAAQTPKARKPESRWREGFEESWFLGASFVDGKRQVRATHLPAAHTARKFQSMPVQSCTGDSGRRQAA